MEKLDQMHLKKLWKSLGKLGRLKKSELNISEDAENLLKAHVIATLWINDDVAKPIREPVEQISRFDVNKVLVKPIRYHGQRSINKIATPYIVNMALVKMADIPKKNIKIFCWPITI